MISSLDLAIIIIYLSSMIGIGIVLSHKEKSEAFFVNNRNTRTALLIFTALSTSVGAGSVIGIIGESYTTGISFGLTFAIVSFTSWMFMAWLAPKIKEWGDKVKAFTFGDFLANRYSHRTRRLASLITICAYFVITAVQFVAFSKLFSTITGLEFIISLAISSIITITYTVLAGIKGDFYTDAIQFFVMFPIFILLFATGFKEIGFNEIFHNLPNEFFSPFEYAGPTFFYGAIAFGFALLLVSMEIWQRIFAAKDAKTARKAFIFSGILKVAVISAGIMLGFLAYHLVPNVDKDTAIFELMYRLLPSGFLGLGFASLLAILMSTIDSMLMVGSATLTKDFYMVKNPEAGEKQKLRFGRLSIVAFGIGGAAVALIFQDIIKLSVISVQILTVFAPAFLGGLLWKKSSEKAAFFSILFGFISTLALLPFMPDTAAVPTLILSTILFITISKLDSKKSLLTTAD